MAFDKASPIRPGAGAPWGEACGALSGPQWPRTPGEQCPSRRRWDWPGCPAGADTGFCRSQVDQRGLLVPRFRANRCRQAAVAAARLQGVPSAPASPASDLPPWCRKRQLYSGFVGAESPWDSLGKGIFPDRWV